jgi:hypothetical protein
MPWKYGVHETENAAACFNACVYATKTEADAAGRELLSRWFLPHHYSVHQTNDAVNYRFDFSAFRPVRLEVLPEE